jgi:hypothetical protein
MPKAFSTLLAVTIASWATGLVSTGGTAQTALPAPGPINAPLFQSATQCMVCHNSLTTPAGEDVSFGSAWGASMMAHSARDPYWHAAVRRETIDHPKAQAAIEQECSKCHMPMAHVESRRTGQPQSVFAHIVGAAGLPANANPLAVEGVSCTLCHQIADDKLGTKESFTGGFTIDLTAPAEQRRMFGPYEIKPGHVALMRSATGVQPTTATHIQRSEVCATCHTLYTHSLNAAGEVIAELPEQVPYEEWLHSEYRTTQSCQSCHMPVVEQPTPITSVLGQPREGVSRHDFRGANFFMLSVLNRFRNDLGVTALPGALDAAVTRTKSFLQTTAATITIPRVERIDGRLDADVVVANLAGHKLPTAYPSRRAWLRVTVTDGSGRVVFASGQLGATGAIEGNDNDQDPLRYEPHHAQIGTPDQVQIYEVIMRNQAGAVTTGLLSGVAYLKDNRIVPRGFDKRTAPPEVAVHGVAIDDPDFGPGEDRVNYLVDVRNTSGPLTIEAQLWYQPIGFRWARNLDTYDTFETKRFVGYYDAMASSTAHMLAQTTRTVSP